MGHKILFEGEYKNGKRWNGKGKEVNIVDKILFEGEYKNGIRWNGIIKEYDKFNAIIYFLKANI